MNQENALTIQKVLSEKNQFNLAMPFTTSRQVNPYYKASVALLTVDTRDEAGQIFKVGSKRIEGQNGRGEFVNLYSLTKPFLMKLATEAGIQFSPNSGDVVKMDDNTWKASAFGAIKLPDGTVRTSRNFKIIDLQTEEKKLRLGYQEKAEKGINDWRMAKAASEAFPGEWHSTGQKDRNGNDIRYFLISPESRRTYIEHSLLDAMTQLRANAPQKAATGAILRVIKDLTGVKGTYTMDELQKPFAVARMSFSPNYDDPEVKRMFLQAAISSTQNLFGVAQPAIQQTITPVTSASDDDEDIIPDVPEIESPQQEEPEEEPEEEPQQIPDSVDASGLPWYNGEQNSAPAKKTPARRTAPAQKAKAPSQAYAKCENCGADIDKKVYDYSTGKYGRALCYTCQRGGNGA